MISRYRAQLMGLAIVLITFCHLDVAQEHNHVEVTRIAALLHTFTVGVDIFVFLSGFGLYYSYRKNKPSYLSFEKHRIGRVLPSYFVIAGITYLIYDLVIQRLTVEKVLRDLFFVSWFAEGRTRYWYILAVSVFYLLFPLLFRFLQSEHGKMKTIVFSLVWWAAVGVARTHSETVELFAIALSRLPIFLVGIYVGKQSYEKKELSAGVIGLMIAFGYLAFLSQKTQLVKSVSAYLYYPIRAVLALAIMWTFILVMQLIENRAQRIYKLLMKVLGWFGGLTLEIYLLHQSTMILFDFPYRIGLYTVVAFALPTVLAGLIYLVRRQKRKG